MNLIIGSYVLLLAMNGNAKYMRNFLQQTLQAGEKSLASVQEFATNLFIILLITSVLLEAFEKCPLTFHGQFTVFFKKKGWNVKFV